MRMSGTLAFIATLASSSGVFASIPVPREVKCPVGAERFTYMDRPSYSVFGRRPDGKPEGSAPFPLELPVCPANGLVMYRTFTTQELARLPALLASPQFQTLRKTETKSEYYRAAWLAGALTPSSPDRAYLLMQAAWQVDGDRRRKARYQAEFVKAATAVRSNPASVEWFVLQVRAINALRELGRFNEASKAFRALPLDALKPKPGSKPNNTEDDLDRQYWRKFLTNLDATIKRRNASSQPRSLVF